MATGSVFSDTLQSITTAKLTALSDKRAAFESRHSETVNSLEAQSAPLARVVTLLEGVKHCFGIDTETDSTGGHKLQGSDDQQLISDLRRLDRFLEQAKFDPSLQGRILNEWEKKLLRYLDTQSQRYQYATLYGQLVTEWLSPDKRKDTAAATPSVNPEINEDFDELPGKKRIEAREQFENSIFTPADIDEGAVKQYLNDLFSDEDASEEQNVRKALVALRDSVQNFQVQLTGPGQFNTYTVARSIKGLLSGDLFAGEKRTVLKNFQNNDIILSEIADVLNMRMSALSTWSWGSEGVPIEQRRKLNGRFDIFMHEDLLQAIFLHFIGVEWSVFFKGAFGRFRRDSWKSNFKQIPRIEKKRREYYLGPQETDEVLARERRRTYRKGYFVYQLLSSAEQEIELNDGEEEAELVAFDCEEEEMERDVDLSAIKKKKKKSSAPGRGLGVGGAMRHRKIRIAQRDDEESDDDNNDTAPKKPMERKQNLLHLLTTEAAVNKRIHGNFTAFRSVFDELQSSLPHQVVMIVMEFFGLSKTWLDFFRAYLEAPLRFMDDEQSDGEPQKRKRGAPTSHALSDVFSESVLFSLDFSVNRRTNGAFLHRLSDDFWFWSHDHAKAATAGQEVRTFAGIMGLPVSDVKGGSISINGDDRNETAGGHALPTGRIRWGMLYFDRDTLRFKIDQKMVDEHTEELEKQLAAKESVFEWIQVWNAYANTFFASNFGKPANCFGREHVDEILATHQQIQKTIFDGKDVAQYVKSMIADRFGVQDLADGFLYFPVQLGGLELQSPFVSPLQVRDNVAKTSTEILDRFEENERQEYRRRKADFDKGNEPEGRDSVRDPGWKPSEGADEFMSFEEYTKYREEFTPEDAENFLLMAYNELLETPMERSIEASHSVMQALGGLTLDHAGGISFHWSNMNAYWKWTAQLYGPEMIERFGGLSVMEAGLLPIGMVGLFRDQKVKWQG
jgi:hypothetical protein